MVSALSGIFPEPIDMKMKGPADMKTACGKLLALAIGIGVMTAPADDSSLRESELIVAEELRRCDVDQAIDLSMSWTVETQGVISLPYSAVGWGLEDLPAGAVVRLDSLDGELIGGIFSPGTDTRDLVDGLTGRGIFAWYPKNIEKKVYRIRHLTTRDGSPVDNESFDAYFDFSDCEMMTESRFRAAVLGVSHPITCANDPDHPWLPVGGDGEGVRNEADGATLSFSFRGAGNFAAELMFEAGSVTVTLDGSVVDTVSAGVQEASRQWSVSSSGAHTLVLTYAGSSEICVRNCRFAENEATRLVQTDCSDQAIDLRAIYPVERLVNEPALQGITYSARGWRLDVPVDAPGRTATIEARPGVLANKVFTPDGASVTVLAATNGEGSVAWRMATVSKKVYQLTHAVMVNGKPDDFATVFGYFDFTACNARASQEEVNVAVLGSVTHPIATVQDEDRPWQPVELGVAGVGIMADSGLASGERTATSFAFRGVGVLFYEFKLDGGALAVWIDGKLQEQLPVTAEWRSGEIAFDGRDAHEVSFAYTSAGNGTAAAIRNVRWAEQANAVCAAEVVDAVRVDLEEGVRTPPRTEDVLPFAYSSTNWIGGVEGATAESRARVTVVQLTGTDLDVTNWTDEVEGTFKVLVEKPGEDAKRWRAKKGVWKATFDILNGDESVYREDAWFDLRNAITPGFMLMVF